MIVFARIRRTYDAEPGGESYLALFEQLTSVDLLHIDDLGAETRHLDGGGCALLTTSVGGAVANWFDGGPLFAHPIEIHQPTPPVRAMWDSLRDPSA